jgi:hypothetical protein
MPVFVCLLFWFAGVALGISLSSLSRPVRLVKCGSVVFHCNRKKRRGRGAPTVRTRERFAPVGVSLVGGSSAKRYAGRGTFRGTER